MRDDVVGAVLAGGSGERMGRQKALLRIGDETFLERTTTTLRTSFDDVIVCGGDRAPAGVELIPDADPGLGPLAGLVSALDRSQERPVFVIAVDLPVVSHSTIERVCGAHLLAAQVRVARGHTRVQPLCGIYSPDVRGLARERLGSDDRSMMGLLRSVPHLTLVDVPPDELANINTESDLRALLAPEGMDVGWRDRQNG